MIHQFLDINVVGFRIFSHNFFTNMTNIFTDVINYGTIDLSNNLFNDFTISTNSTLPVLYKM